MADKRDPRLTHFTDQLGEELVHIVPMVDRVYQAYRARGWSEEAAVEMAKEAAVDLTAQFMETYFPDLEKG
jgi:hypothetical protein